MRRLLTSLAFVLLAGVAQAAPAVEIVNGATPGALEIHASGLVELSSELIVERQMDDGSFQPVRNLDLSSLTLAATCTERASACIRVDARGLRPVAWSGMSCSSQCNKTCDKNERLTGRFRFVVRTCDGAARFEGPLFDLGKNP